MDSRFAVSSLLCRGFPAQVVCSALTLFAGVCDGGKRGRAAWARRRQGEMFAFAGTVVQS
jgi:hypothetical protein